MDGIVESDLMSPVSQSERDPEKHGKPLDCKESPAPESSHTKEQLEKTSNKPDRKRVKVEPVEINPQESITEADIPPLDNDWALFLFKTWKLDQTKFEFMINHASKSNQRMVCSILEGEWTQYKSKSVVNTIWWIGENLSEFVGGILIVDFIRTLKPSKMIKVYEGACYEENTSSKMDQLMNLIIIFKLQGIILMEHPDTDLLNKLPASIKSQISLDFSASISEKQTGTRRILMTIEEHNISVKITSILLGLMHQHVNKYFVNREASIDIFTKCTSYLTLTVTNFIATLLEAGPNVFKTLIKTAHQERMGTTKYVFLTLDCMENELHFHEEILKCKFLVNNYNRWESTIINATEKDASTFIELVYNYNPKNMAGKLTVGVCQIARWAGIPNVWDFLFRGNFKAENVQEDESLIAVLFHLDRQEEINNVIDKIPASSMESTITNFSFHLLFHQFATLLSNDRVVLSGLLKYKICIKWAYASAGIHCIDPMTCHVHDKVLNYYNLVKHAIPLEAMSNDLTLLRGLGYVSEEDELMARCSSQTND